MEYSSSLDVKWAALVRYDLHVRSSVSRSQPSSVDTADASIIPSNLPVFASSVPVPASRPDAGSVVVVPGDQEAGLVVGAPRLREDPYPVRTERWRGDRSEFRDRVTISFEAGGGTAPRHIAYDRNGRPYPIG